jgi:Glyoxalase-like domain
LPRPDTLATFRSQALGYDVIGGAGSYVFLLPPGGEGGPQFLLQRVPEPKQTKNRMHFDIHTATSRRKRRGSSIWVPCAPS